MYHVLYTANNSNYNCEILLYLRWFLLVVLRSYIQFSWANISSQSNFETKRRYVWTVEELSHVIFKKTKK